MQWSILGGQASLMHGIARELTDCGLTAVTFDMRGVGGSSGSRTVRGAAEVEDVRAVVETAPSADRVTVKRIRVAYRQRNQDPP